MIPQEVAEIRDIILKMYDDSVEFRLGDWALDVAQKIYNELDICKCN